MITIAIIVCAILFAVGFLHWWTCPNGPQISEWGYGRGKYNIGWAVYRDGKVVSWDICYPICKFEARCAAFNFARIERHGKQTKCDTYKSGVMVVVKSKNAFTDAEKDAYIAKLEHDLGIK